MHISLTMRAAIVKTAVLQPYLLLLIQCNKGGGGGAGRGALSTHTPRTARIGGRRPPPPLGGCPRGCCFGCPRVLPSFPGPARASRDVVNNVCVRMLQMKNLSTPTLARFLSTVRLVVFHYEQPSSPPPPPPPPPTLLSPVFFCRGRFVFPPFVSRAFKAKAKKESCVVQFFAAAIDKTGFIRPNFSCCLYKMSKWVPPFPTL